jgi:hypothetical protein
VTKFDLWNTSYESCVANFHGDNIFVYGDLQSVIIKPENLNEIISDSSYYEKFYGEKKDGSYELLIKWILESVAIYLSESGSDDDGCGTYISPCQYILFLFVYIYCILFYFILLLLYFIFFFNREMSEGINQINPANGRDLILILDSALIRLPISLSNIPIFIGSSDISAKSTLIFEDEAKISYTTASAFPNVFSGLIFTMLVSEGITSCIFMIFIYCI